MIEIQRNDFMRAVYYHKLNTTYSCSFSQDYIKGKWTLGHEIVCIEKDGRNGFNSLHETFVSESFKNRYVDTTPNDAYRCRSCSKLCSCKIVRSDKERFCNNWIPNN